MTIKEIIDNQHKDESTLYLLQQGLFYHAYNEGAEYFHQLMGYKLRHLYFPHGEMYSIIGFPISSLDKVIEKLQKAQPGVIVCVSKTCVRVEMCKAK